MVAPLVNKVDSKAQEPTVKMEAFWDGGQYIRVLLGPSGEDNFQLRYQEFIESQAHVFITTDKSQRPFTRVTAAFAVQGKETITLDTGEYLELFVGVPGPYWDLPAPKALSEIVLSLEIVAKSGRASKIGLNCPVRYSTEPNPARLR